MATPQPPDFTGDESNAEANKWLRQVIKYSLSDPSLTQEKRDTWCLQFFARSLAEDSRATEWWDDLNDAKKDTWQHVEEAFREEWPPPKAVALTSAEKLHSLIDFAKSLSQSDLTRPGLGKPEQPFLIEWTRELEARAKRAKVTDARLLVAEMRRFLPTALVKAVGEDDKTWDGTLEEVAKKIREVDRGRLRAAIELETKLSDITILLSQQSLGVAASSNPSDNHLRVSHPPSPAFPHRSLSRPPSYSSMNRSPSREPPRTSYAPRSPFEIPASQNIPPKDPSIVIDLFPTTQAAYNESTRKWQEKWGRLTEPSVARPFPVSPNTADPSRSACFRCGLEGHGARDCQARGDRTLPLAEQSYRRAVFRARQQDRGRGRPGVSVNEVDTYTDYLYRGNRAEETGLESGKGEGSA